MSKSRKILTENLGTPGWGFGRAEFPFTCNERNFISEVSNE
jgi:hypothetical protein